MLTDTRSYGRRIQYPCVNNACLADLRADPDGTATPSTSAYLCVGHCLHRLALSAAQNFALALISGVAPALLVPVVSVLTERSLADLHSGWLGLLVSLAITGSVTNIVKVVVGRPRPGAPRAP